MSRSPAPKAPRTAPSTEAAPAYNLDELYASLSAIAVLLADAEAGLCVEWRMEDMERCEALLAGAAALVNAERSRLQKRFEGGAE